MVVAVVRPALSFCLAPFSSLSRHAPAPLSFGSVSDLVGRSLTGCDPTFLVGLWPGVMPPPQRAHSPAPLAKLEDIFHVSDPRRALLREAGITLLPDKFDSNFEIPMVKCTIGLRPKNVRAKEWRDQYNESQPMHPILEFPAGNLLWLGGKNAGHDKKTLLENDISVRFCCADKHALWPSREFKDIHIDTNALTEGTIPIEEFIKKRHQVWDYIEAGHSVLVFCLQGANRSPLITMILVMQATDCSVMDAVKYVRSLRGIVEVSEPGPGCSVSPLDFLREHEERLLTEVWHRHLYLCEMPPLLTRGQFVHWVRDQIEEEAWAEEERRTGGGSAPRAGTETVSDRVPCRSVPRASPPRAPPKQKGSSSSAGPDAAAAAAPSPKMTQVPLSPSVDPDALPAAEGSSPLEAPSAPDSSAPAPASPAPYSASAPGSALAAEPSSAEMVAKIAALEASRTKLVEALSGKIAMLSKRLQMQDEKEVTAAMKLHEALLDGKFDTVHHHYFLPLLPTTTHYYPLLLLLLLRLLRRRRLLRIADINHFVIARGLMWDRSSNG